MVNESLEQLLFFLTENKRHNWDAEKNAMGFFLGKQSKLYFFEDSKGFNVHVCLDANELKTYSLVVHRCEIINFIKTISLAGEKNFELSYQKEFPDDFKRVAQLTEKVLKGESLEKRYEVVTQDNVISIKDKIYNCTNKLIFYYPEYEKYMGNFHIECKFYPSEWANKTISIKKIIPPESIKEYPFLKSLLIPSKIEVSNKLTNIEKFITQLKECRDTDISSIALMIEMEKTLVAKNNKEILKKI